MVLTLDMLHVEIEQFDRRVLYWIKTSRLFCKRLLTCQLKSTSKVLYKFLSCCSGKLFAFLPSLWYVFNVILYRTCHTMLIIYLKVGNYCSTLGKKKKKKKKKNSDKSTKQRKRGIVSESLSNFFQTFNCQEATVSKRFSGLQFYFVTGFAPIGNKTNY